jgi:hypothetical protein
MNALRKCLIRIKNKDEENMISACREKLRNPCKI